MYTADEKRAFAERLNLALKRSKQKINGPTDLALQFNLRHPNEPITPQSAYKWLHGKTLPSPDKIDTLAGWLNVSPHWLRHGPPGPSRPATRITEKRESSETPSAEELKLLARLRGLGEHQRYLVLELVEQMALQGEIS